MKVAIVGGGFTGLTAAYELAKLGHSVTVFEKDTALGGLAVGWRPPRNASQPASQAERGGQGASAAGGEKSWDWHLEKAYHHLFTNDDAIIGLVAELGIGNKLIIKRPITANYVPLHLATSTDAANQIYQLDSPIHLLQFPGLSLFDKLRTGALAAFCKVYPFWQTLEGVTAKDFFRFWGGSAAWNVIWEPLMTGKFGHMDNTIAASWLWARIHKRTPSLAYIEGGFQTLINTLEKAIKRNGGKIYTGIMVDSIPYESGIRNQESGKKRNHHSLFIIHNSKFDRVLLTTPTPITAAIMPELKSSLSEALKIPHLHAQVLILETRYPILDTTYWLSITDRSFPFLAVVAHTNFMDKNHYGGHHITYIGNYLPSGHPYLTMSKVQLLKKFMPFVRRLNPDLKSKILNLKSYLFTAPYAQPVHQTHYSAVAPKLTTPLPGVYIANMDSIYPWDRGTNYAVELGQKAALALESAAPAKAGAKLSSRA